MRHSSERRDSRVSTAAASEDRAVITLDRGFADVRFIRQELIKGCCVVRARDLRPSVILMLVATFLTERAFEDFLDATSSASRTPRKRPASWAARAPISSNARGLAMKDYGLKKSTLCRSNRVLLQ